MDENALDSELLEAIKTNAANTKNVAIFIDYDNTYYSMKTYAADISSENYNICKLLNSIYSMKKIRTFRAYADFDQVEVTLKSLQEQRVQIRNVYGNGKEEQYRKNASDIELSLDALETYYRNSEIDTFVFITADSDMIPIMSRLMYKGKNVHLFYTKENISQTQHMESYCDFSCDLIQLFHVDTEKAKPSYWFDTVKNIIISWYQEPRNANKAYGGKWLQEDIIKHCGISSIVAGNIIGEMQTNKLIEKVTINGNSGYNIVAESNTTS